MEDIYALLENFNEDNLTESQEEELRKLLLQDMPVTPSDDEIYEISTYDLFYMFINGDGFFRPDPVELERNQEFQELYARIDQEIYEIEKNMAK